MSFQAYPEYRETGVEWFTKLPRDWKFITLKRLVDPSRQITYGIVQAGPHTPDGIPYIRPADMSDECGIVDPDSILRTTEKIAQNYSRSSIKSGDIVCSIGPSFGKVMIVPDWLSGGNLTQGTARVAVNSHVDAKYIFWVLRAEPTSAQWESSIGGATFRALNLWPLAQTIVCLPSTPEQRAISSFLDRETAKIDALIAEQERLMELLKEKRQAVISHAVTKGLNPDAPMKDSGVEWLGEVPAHWLVATIRRAIARIEQGWSPECENQPAEGDQWGVLKAGCVNRGVYNAQDNKALPSNLTPRAELEVRVGDVLMSRASGSPELVGSTAYVSHTPSQLMLSDKIFRLVCEEIVDPQFLVMLLNSRLMRSQIERAISGAEGLANNLPQSALLTFACAIPPVGEQLTIVDRLKTTLSAIDSLVSAAEQAIDLLNERRTALISAAVTGQIDVRHLANADAA